ncbi:hypothetical protein [Nitratireductor sp. ZSWI3]|nr:hypothetical protein [Nitratireductor sp. ZSWI3]MCR4268292.1 hypothetical protein [Nitratireductor sp. ZSWI3]
MGCIIPARTELSPSARDFGGQAWILGSGPEDDEWWEETMPIVNLGD